MLASSASTVSELRRDECSVIRRCRTPARRHCQGSNRALEAPLLAAGTDQEGAREARAPLVLVGQHRLAGGACRSGCHLLSRQELRPWPLDPTSPSPHG